MRPARTRPAAAVLAVGLYLAVQLAAILLVARLWGGL
jgi:hypothetical protein